MKESTRKVVRGGAWYYNQVYVHEDFRDYFYPYNRIPRIGFRVVLRKEGNGEVNERE